MNDLLKFGLDKEILKKDYRTIRSYVDKIDAYTTYEYFSGVITEEGFNEALERFKSKKATTYTKPNELKDFKPIPNPSRLCVFKGNSPRARCEKCNSIRKYMSGKECPMYVENIKQEENIKKDDNSGGETLGSTVVKND